MLAVAAALAYLTIYDGSAVAGGDIAYQKAKSSFATGNNSEAAQWLEKAVSQGHRAAQLPLAAMYRDGLGVDQDYKRAVVLFTRAAEYGYPSAQFSLGVMYRFGDGVRRDYTEAVKWYRMAARQGDAESQNSLGIAYESGRGTKTNFKIAYVWYQVAAENGSQRADNNLRRLKRKLSTVELVVAEQILFKCLRSKYHSCD